MNIGIVGITGSVGIEMLNCIDLLKIKFNKLELFASEKSKGKKLRFMNKEYVIDIVNENSFKEMDVVLFAVDSNLSKIYFEYAKKYDCMVIDNSSAFRMNINHPLIIPEINSDLINNNNGLISNPNCSTILMNLVLWKIYKKFGIERIVVSTYQAASGAGIKGIEELENQNKEYTKYKNVTSKQVFGKQYVWNVFSHNSPINIENGYNEEELKIINETKKIFNDNEIKISVTCIRVPVFRAHSESINITLKNKATEKEIRNVLSKTEGIEIIDDRENNIFPEPILASKNKNVIVGRIRPDLGQEKDKGFELFISGDQILKGAALNAVQILKLFYNKNFK
jgi:aspartate-semialdehyde dehydrogenase